MGGSTTSPKPAAFSKLAQHVIIALAGLNVINVTASSNPILLSNKGTHHDLRIVLSVPSWRAGPVCEEGENTPVKPFKFAGAPAAFPVHWFHSHTRQLRVFPLKLLFNILVYFLSIIYCTKFRTTLPVYMNWQIIYQHHRVISLSFSAHKDFCLSSFTVFDLLLTS